MAVLEVKVPQLSESVTEATLLQWHKKAGEKVVLDENLVDIETDKVVLELPSPAAGVLSSILKKDGDIVVAGEVIARIDTEAVASVSPAPAGTSAPAAEKTCRAERELRLEKRVLTEKDVSDALAGHFTSIRLPAKCILTALAQDCAKDRGIRLERD